MGNNFTKFNFITRFFKKSHIRIFMLGLDNSGKTTILYALKLNELITTIPTIGFNVETITYKNIIFTIWDIGGQDKIRDIWIHYYNNTLIYSVIIFVIDSSDRDRIKYVKEEFTNIITHLNNAKILIYANKQDITNCMTIEEIITILQLDKISNKCFVQPTCALDHQGIYEGLEWLSNEIKFN